MKFGLTIMVGYSLLFIWTIISAPLSRVHIKTQGWHNHTRDSQYNYLVLWSVGVCVITGLRHLIVGPDSDSYASYFTNLHAGRYLTGYDRFERGFELFSKCLAAITGSYTVYFFAIAILIMCCYSFMICKSKSNHILSFVLFITIGPFVFQLTGLRQAIAMSFCAASVVFVKERKIIPYTVLVFLGYMFHKSTLFFVPFYFIGCIKFNVKSFLLYTSGMIAALLVNERFLSVANNLLGYEKPEEFGQGGIVSLIIYVSVIVAAFIYRKNIFYSKDISNSGKQGDRYEYNVVFYNMSCITLIMFIMRYWIRMADRVCKYYQIGAVLLLANTIISIQDKKTRQIVGIMAVILTISLFYYRQTRPGSEYVYYFCWQLPNP